MSLILIRSRFSRGRVAAGLGDAPMFDSGNADHVSHVFEDFSLVTSPTQFATTDRPDGGPPWSPGDTDHQSLITSDLHPFGGAVRTLEMDYQDPPPVDILGHGLSLPNEFAIIRNAGSAKDALVWEWAAKHVNGSGDTPIYRGKVADMLVWHGYVQRYDYDGPASGFPVGDQSRVSCDADDLCNNYWDDNGSTPLFPNMPPSDDYGGDISINLSRSDSGQTYFYRQNRGFGAGAGLWDGGSANGANFNGAGWYRHIIRLTRGVGTQYGYGRVEEWIQFEGKSPIKIKQYYGDIGQQDEGLVFVQPSSLNWFTDIDGNGHGFVQTFNFYNQTAVLGNFNGGATTRIGYLRMWSQSRAAL